MRNLLMLGGLILAILVTVLSRQEPAAASTIPCREVFGSGGGYVCGADADSLLMDRAFQVSQTQSGCWAVSMAMIIATNRSEISEADILSSVFGTSVPATLTLSQALGYSSHSFTAANSAVIDTTASALFSSPIGESRSVLRSLADQLADDNPLLIFTTHNAMVLTKIYYHASLFGKPTSLYVAVVRDPFPQTGPPITSGVKLDGSPGQRFLTTAEYNDIQSVIQISVRNH